MGPRSKGGEQIIQVPLASGQGDVSRLVQAGAGRRWGNPPTDPHYPWTQNLLHLFQMLGNKALLGQLWTQLGEVGGGGLSTDCKRRCEPWDTGREGKTKSLFPRS